MLSLLRAILTAFAILLGVMLCVVLYQMIRFSALGVWLHVRNAKPSLADREECFWGFLVLLCCLLTCVGAIVFLTRALRRRPTPKGFEVVQR
jgi:hypothetical protein